MDENNNTTNTAAAEREPEAPAPETAELSELKRQRDEYYDLLLRKTAEFDNYRKRIERERQTLAESAAAGVIEELLPLVDDLERALKADAGAEGVEAYRRGVELIHRQLLEICSASAGSGRSRRSAPTSIRTIHQAVSHEPADGAPRGRSHRGVPARVHAR